MRSWTGSTTSSERPLSISAIEHGLAGLKDDFAAMQASMDSIDRRLDKIEDHIELVIA